MTGFLGYIGLKNNVLRDQKRLEAINKIVEKIQEVPEFKNYKDDLEFLLFCCTLCEHIIDNKDKDQKNKMDKKEIVMQAYQKAFDKIDPVSLSKNIEFLHENKRIKKVKFHKIIWANIKDWCIRRIL